MEGRRWLRGKMSPGAYQVNLMNEQECQKAIRVLTIGVRLTGTPSRRTRRACP